MQSIVQFVHSVPSIEPVPISLVLACSATYLALVLVGKEFMKNRSPFKIPVLLAIHNGVLCVYSFLTVSLLLALLAFQPYNSVREAICDPKKHFTSGAPGLLLMVFIHSKSYEFLDTAFLILQKSRLRFLHVYHHAVTLVLGHLIYNDGWMIGWVCGVTNAAVHFPMYWYYTKAALGGNCWWKKYLTSFQIAQFITVLALMIFDIGTRVFIGHCPAGHPVSALTIASSFAIYGSFLYLFAQLYRENYLSKKPVVVKDE